MRADGAVPPVCTVDPINIGILSGTVEDEFVCESDKNCGGIIVLADSTEFTEPFRFLAGVFNANVKKLEKVHKGDYITIAGKVRSHGEGNKSET